jgi:hypothetical protein
MSELSTHKTSGLKTALGSTLRKTPAAWAKPINFSTSEFSEACSSNTVTAVYVQESDSGFGLFLNLKNDPNTRVLATPNQLQRNWSNLNSLLSFLHRHKTPVDELTIRLNKSTSHENLDDEAL